MTQRFDTILPELMRREQIDMWIVVCSAHHEDPVYRPASAGPPTRVIHKGDAVRGGIGITCAGLTSDVQQLAHVPMSLADACLVRMTKLNGSRAVMTLDADFLVYRRHGRQVIPVMMPPELAASRR